MWFSILLEGKALTALGAGVPGDAVWTVACRGVAGQRASRLLVTEISAGLEDRAEGVLTGDVAAHPDPEQVRTRLGTPQGVKLSEVLQLRLVDGVPPDIEADGDVVAPELTPRRFSFVPTTAKCRIGLVPDM